MSKANPYFTPASLSFLRQLEQVLSAGIQKRVLAHFRAADAYMQFLCQALE